MTDWTAQWCGPCKRIAPIYKDLSDAHPSDTFLKIDVDEHAELAANAGISAMPTFQLYRDGKMLEQIVGADPNTLTSCVEKHSAQ